MGESREALLIVPDTCYLNAVAQVLDAADHADEPVQAGVEAALAMAELDPDGAQTALWRLQTDWKTLSELEERLGGEPTQAALRIGAAIHFARAALASTPVPQLRARVPELMELLGRRQLSAAK